jgi:hypothetical protein
MSPAAKTAPVKQESDAWIPVLPGDELVGVVISVDSAWSDVRNNGKGGFYPLIRVRKDDGNTASIHGFRTVLENEILKRQPVQGERIRVRFTGVSDKEQSKGRSAPWLFTLEVARTEAQRKAEAKNIYAALGGNRFAPPAEEITTEDVERAFGDVTEVTNDDIPF